MELESLKSRILACMEESIQEGEVAGVSLLVEREGREYVYAQAGERDRKEKKPMERDTILRLYSQTKPVTAAAAAILMERGKLDLYEPVEKYLPSFASVKVAGEGGLTPPKRSILVGDLMNMTSGIAYPGEEGYPQVMAGMVFSQAEGFLGTCEEYSTLELANALSRVPLLFSPGESWAYGASADVLGAVISVCSGVRFGEFLRRELFEPLGMRDTGFYVPSSARERLIRVYQNGSSREEMKEYTGSYLAISHSLEKPPRFESGGAGLVSTLDDYARFARMLLREGKTDEGRQLLQPSTVRFLTRGERAGRAQEAFEGAWTGLEGYTYGNLMRVAKHPGRSCQMVRKGEYGWDGWLGTYFANFPKEQVTFLMGTAVENSGTFSLTHKLRNIVLSSLPL